MHLHVRETAKTFINFFAWTAAKRVWVITNPTIYFLTHVSIPLIIVHAQYGSIDWNFMKVGLLNGILSV
jgi:hypothetical protein